VLVDLEMPDTDGLALATEIRQGDGVNAASMLILISAAENQAPAKSGPSMASSKSQSMAKPWLGSLVREHRRRPLVSGFCRAWRRSLVRASASPLFELPLPASCRLKIDQEIGMSMTGIKVQRS